LIILSNRELQEQLFNGPGFKLIKSSEIRTNEPISKQIAVVWVDPTGEGLAPNFSGIWLDGRKGRVIEIENRGADRRV